MPKAGHPDWLPVLLDEQGQQAHEGLGMASP